MFYLSRLVVPAIMQPIRCRIEPTFRHSPILQHVFFATVPTDPRPEPSLTFLILVIYKCCPDLDVFVAQRLPRPFRLDSLACRKDFLKVGRRMKMRNRSRGGY